MVSTCHPNVPRPAVPYPEDPSDEQDLWPNKMLVPVMRCKYQHLQPLDRPALDQPVAGASVPKRSRSTFFFLSSACLVI